MLRAMTISVHLAGSVDLEDHTESWEGIMNIKSRTSLGSFHPTIPRYTTNHKHHGHLKTYQGGSPGLLNGQDAAECDEYDDPEVKNRSPNMIVKYIKAVPGANFQIKVRARSSYPEKVGNSITYRAFVDEDYAAGIILNNGEKESSYRLKGWKKRHPGGLCVRLAFEFDALDVGMLWRKSRPPVRVVH